MSKIANVNINVPYKAPGNTIIQHPVNFDIYAEDERFRAVPNLPENERRVANLPEELLFVYENGKPVSSRGKSDGNFHAIESIVTELRKQNLI